MEKVLIFRGYHVQRGISWLQKKYIGIVIPWLIGGRIGGSIW